MTMKSMYRNILDAIFRLLYYYLVESLLPSSSVLPSGDSGGTSPRSPFGGHQGRFLTGGPQGNMTAMNDIDFKVKILTT